MGLGIFDGKVEQNPDGVGFLPLLLPLVAAPTIYTGYKALQAARSVAAAASSASGDALQPTVDAFKTCANQLAVRSGYRAVPAGPLLAKTCGLAVDPVSTGCPSRDYLIQACNERKITPEPLAKMTVSEAEAAAAAAEEEEEETGVSGFLRSKTALYLGATVIGVLVLAKMRSNARKAPVKNPRRRQRSPSPKARQIAEDVMLRYHTGYSPYRLSVEHGITIDQARTILTGSPSYFGPGGEGLAKFQKFVDRVIR